MSGQPCVMVYTTWPDEDTARALAHTVIERKLAACANIFPAGRSVYIWDGAVQDSPEVYMILKTTRAGFDALKNAIKAGHPYAVPCIVALDIADGDQPYLDWVRSGGK